MIILRVELTKAVREAEWCTISCQMPRRFLQKEIYQNSINRFQYFFTYILFPVQSENSKISEILFVCVTKLETSQSVD